MLQRDPGTGLMNSQDFRELLGFELKRAGAERRDLSVAQVDLDHFGNHRRVLGPAYADLLRARFARVLRSRVGDGTMLAHDRGDAYWLLLPSIPVERALIMLEDLRREVAAHGFDLQGPEGVREARLTLTGGVAAYPRDGQDPETLLRATWLAMIRGKQEGRDRIVLAATRKMVLKTNFYPPDQLAQLARLARATGRKESELLRSALDRLFEEHESHLRTGSG